MKTQLFTLVLILTSAQVSFAQSAPSIEARIVSGEARRFLNHEASDAAQNKKFERYQEIQLASILKVSSVNVQPYLLDQMTAKLFDSKTGALAYDIKIEDGLTRFVVVIGLIPRTKHKFYVSKVFESKADMIDTNKPIYSKWVPIAVVQGIGEGIRYNVQDLHRLYRLVTPASE